WMSAARYANPAPMSTQINVDHKRRRVRRGEHGRGGMSRRWRRTARSRSGVAGCHVDHILGDVVAQLTRMHRVELRVQLLLHAMLMQEVLLARLYIVSREAGLHALQRAAV